MVHSGIVGGDDTYGGNLQAPVHAGQLQAEVDHFDHSVAGSAIDGYGRKWSHHRDHCGATDRYGDRKGSRRCLSSTDGQISSLLRLDLEIYQQLTFTYLLHCYKVSLFDLTLGKRSVRIGKFRKQRT